MLKLSLLGETKFDFSTVPLEPDVRLLLDKHSADPLSKFEKLVNETQGTDVSANHIYLCFYFELPDDLVDFLINHGTLRINYNNVKEGFMSGRLIDYQRLVFSACSEKADQRVRVLGNLLYNFLSGRYRTLFKHNKIKQLSDKTYSLEAN